MYASLSYIQSRHPYGDIPGQPSQAPQASAAINTVPNSAVSLANGDQHQFGQQPQQPGERVATPPPENPEIFDAALRELARDLVLKEQQIEYLINSLPGIGNSEADQEKRMRELEIELREVEAERTKAEEEREALVEGLGRVIVGTKRVP